jgi:hypothetical protein
MLESDIILLYIRSRVWGIIYAMGPSVATVQTPRSPFSCDGSGRPLWHWAMGEARMNSEVFQFPFGLFIEIQIKF